LPEVSPALAEPIGGHEDLPGGERTGDAVMANGGQPHGCDAAALSAIRVSSKLAWSNSRVQIGGDDCGGSRKDAAFRIAGWGRNFVNDGFVHVEFWVFDAKPAEVGDGRCALRRS
jgi:hypothetical protein